jgi:hypothetical protein
MMHDGKALQSALRTISETDLHGHLKFSFKKGKQIKLSSSNLLGNVNPCYRRNYHGSRRDNGWASSKIAPTQLLNIPCRYKKKACLKKAAEVYDRLKNVVRAKIDTSDKMPG